MISAKVTDNTPLLDAEAQEQLLCAARRAIETYLQTGRRLQWESTSARLLVPQAAFVTLHEGPALRGCIGTFEATQPLVDVVIDMAIAAATGDPRFSPLDHGALPRVTIELSVLSPRKITAAEDVVVGRDGVVVSRGGQRGVLLPQVATEHGWDRVTFLQQTCRKAGLPLDAWNSPGTKIEVFEAQIIPETSRIVDSHLETCDTSLPCKKANTNGLS